jgi:hypothetical protein
MAHEIIIESGIFATCLFQTKQPYCLVMVFLHLHCSSRGYFVDMNSFQLAAVHNMSNPNGIAISIFFNRVRTTVAGSCLDNCLCTMSV